MQTSSPTPQQQLLTWWVLWGAFQAGVVFIYLFLGRAASPNPASEPAWWQAAFLPVLISGAIRWTLLPMFKEANKAMPCFILGVAMAEASCFLGIFVFPSHKLPLFVASVLGILQFIPVYAGRYFAPRSDD